MRTIKIAAVIIALTGLMYVELTSGNEQVTYSENYTPEIKYRKDNQAVFVAGCQTHNPPVPAQITYPSVKNNFVTLLCALEVPPPMEALALQRFPLKGKTAKEN